MRPDNSLHAWSTLISKEKMLESRTENMQSRLRYIQWGDANQLYCEDVEDKPSAIPTHAEPVVAKRVEARHNSSNLLLELLFKSNSKTIPGAAVSKYSSDQKGDISNWWLWVERFERERREEKILLDCTPEHDTSEHLDRERQLHAWDAELIAKQDKSARALKIVLKYKATKHADRKALCEDSLQRLLAPSFPQELLETVIEATVKSQIPHLAIVPGTCLIRLAENVFPKWPDDVGGDTRIWLRRLAARAILEHSIVKVDTAYAFSYTLAPSPLPALQGSEHIIRFLALELHIEPRNDTRHEELDRGIESMASLNTLFPKLESCTFLLHLSHDHARRFWKWLFARTPQESCHARDIPRFRNIRSTGEVVSLEQTFIEFIAAFLEDGPGKRKLVQFSHEEANRSDFVFGKRIVQDRSHGPLVRVDHQASPSDEAIPIGEFAMARGRPATDAEHIFAEAYWGKLGNLRASYRRQRVLREA